MKIICMGDAHYASLPFKSKFLKEKNKYFYTNIFSELFKEEADIYVSLGDMTNYGRKAHTREVYSIINSCKGPDKRFVQVTGNHDLLAMTKETYKEITGQKLYWTEENDECKMIFLDTCKQMHPGRSSSRVDLDQRLFLEEELAKAGEKLTLVFAHHPPERVIFYDKDGKVDSSVTMEGILSKKKGRGVYINGHLHKDKFYTKGSWAFLQFNDILDEPTIRELVIKDGKLEMKTRAIHRPEMMEAAARISRAILTFYRSRNDELFARVRDLKIVEGVGDRGSDCSMDFVRLTSNPRFSKEAASRLRSFVRFFKPGLTRV